LGFGGYGCGVARYVSLFVYFDFFTFTEVTPRSWFKVCAPHALGVSPYSTSAGVDH
jgi:hypothetical protein